MRASARWIGLGVLGLLFAFTVRAGIRLCYRDYDQATEHLSYAQGTPDVKRAMREIQLISERSVGDRDIFVAYDDQSSWPFVWYLRDYPKARTWGMQPQFAQGAAVILTGPKNREGAWPLVADGYVKREYRLIWWPKQGYAGKGPGDDLEGSGRPGEAPSVVAHGDVPRVLAVGRGHDRHREVGPAAGLRHVRARRPGAARARGAGPR